MNYLAHLHLGGQRPEELLGSLYGDFVKGRLQGQYSPAIESAIQLHRSIDVFTDAHPLVDQSLSRFTQTRRRYAGIVLDVFFDHCLARDWARYADQPLERFIGQRQLGIPAWALPERHDQVVEVREHGVQDRKSTRLNSSHGAKSRMPSSA